MILGLDISTACTGWGLLHMDGSLHSFGEIPFNKKDDFAKKVLFLSQNICSLLYKNEIKYIGIEDQFFHRNAKTLKTLARFSGIACLEAALRDIPFFFKAPLNVKKVFTGNGRASKQDVIDKVKEVYGVEVSNDTADAIAIAYTIFKTETGEISVDQEDQE